METRDERLQKIALMVHSLHPEDRHWLMRKLGDEQTGLLKPMLDELAMLGIPSDKQMIESFFCEESTTSDSKTNHLGSTSFMSKLDKLGAEEIFAVLCDEAPEFVARVLEIRNWRWQLGLMQLFDRQKVSLIQACQRQRDSEQEGLAQAVLFNESVMRHLWEVIIEKQVNQSPMYFSNSTPNLDREEVAEDVKTSEVGFFARMKSKFYRTSSMY